MRDMRKITWKQLVSIIATTGILLLSLFFIVYRSQKAIPPSVLAAQNDPLPPLYVKGESLYRSDTHTPVILKGAVSDFFRDPGTFHTYISAQGIESEIYLTNKLKTYGANLIGFYLANTQQLQQNIDQLDTFIEYANHHGIYVYLMPVARNFEGAPGETYDDLKKLIEFLASRYKTYPHILYGLGAEPEMQDETFDTWNKKQEELAQIVRHYNPEAILLITNVSYYTGLNKYTDVPFPLSNIIYFGGGYASNTDENARTYPTDIDTEIQHIVMQLPHNHALLMGEFGGNYAKDFSSDMDLDMIYRILTGIQKRNLSFTAYKLSAARPEDPLSIFDIQGNITPRGKVFINAIEASPGTEFGANK